MLVHALIQKKLRSCSKSKKHDRTISHRTGFFLIPFSSRFAASDFADSYIFD